MPLLTTFKKTIVTGEYRAVVLPEVNEIHALSLWTGDQSDYLMANDDSGTGEIKLPSGLPIGPTFAKPLRFGSSDVVVCYIKGTTDTTISGYVI